MNKILYVGVDMPTAVESNRNSSIMCGVFTSIRNEIRAAENSGHYACVVELQSASPHSHDFICEVLSGLGYNVKHIDYDNNYFCISISWDNVGDENV